MRCRGLDLGHCVRWAREARTGGGAYARVELGTATEVLQQFL
jgi:hypothetical protein